MVDISPNQDGGVIKEILKEGTGNALPPKGSKVKVHYTGTLVDGTKFDSSRDRDSPFEFDLGKGAVIKGWDIGVATMKKDEQAMLTCTAPYAYGENGSPPTIPPNATLKFDVEVIDWKGEDLSPKKDGGIERAEILTVGEGFSSPNDGALVEAHITGKYEDNIFEDRDVSFCIGEGSEANIIPGVEKALEKFKKGETSRLIIKPKYAFGNKGNQEYNIPSNATVEYVVSLKNFEKAKESWIDVEEKVKECKMFKEKGTNYFKGGKFLLAIKFYNKIIDFLDSEKDGNEETKTDITALLLAAHLNISLCHLKLNNNFEAKSSATKALEIDPKNEKALFRRGQANLALKDAVLASKDFAACLEVDPNNQAAKTQHVICAKVLKDELQKEKKIYANMFDKFAKMDAQKEEVERQPNVLSSVGEWGQEDREREPGEFEKENPNILLLNSSGEFKDM